MNKKPDNTTLIATAAVTLAAAAATYMFFKTYKTIQKLDELELDFGNDDALLSFLNTKNRMRDE
jgi:hypothetical protein